VGFDSRQSLGDKETGARAALPIWMDFMKQAVAGKPDEQFPGDMKGAAPNFATRVASASSRKPGPG
jgi:penicillin-binding protein 1A